MFLIFNKESGLVVQTSEVEPVVEADQDFIFAHDPELNLANYESIKVVGKEGCHLELIPTIKWKDKLNGSSNITLNEKIAKLEHYSLVLMEAVAKLSEATPDAICSDLMAELVLAGKRTIDQVPADIQKDVSGRIETASEL